MSLRRHTLSDKLFFELAAGGGGPAAAEFLRAAQYSKHLLLIRGVRDAAAGHPEAARTAEAFELLARIQQADGRAVDAVLRHPTVGVWARRTVLALEGKRTAPARPEGLTALAAAAAIRAGFPTETEIPAYDGIVRLPSLGRAVFNTTADRALIRTGPEPATVTLGETTVALPANPHQDAPGWEGLRRLIAEHQGRRIDLLLDDQDPDRMPGSPVIAHRLSPAEVARWQEHLHAAWEMLVRQHWTIAEETAGTLRTLTPLPAPRGGQTSATAPHCFGGIGLSEPPNPHSMAVTFAHEVQHTKLTALLDLERLTNPDDGTRYYAPWRDDPRPAAGLLQGVYAHLGIAGFWRRQRQHESGDQATRAHTSFARWRDAAAGGARTLLESAALTPPGERFVLELTRTLDDWRTEPVPHEAAAQAAAQNAQHRTDWQHRNGPVR
ncbi:HEXXH motif domain-containing protein [Actinomadura hibisca]|uniref:HEXXH motif domain-containing protein n=1 Tax=Actinomadura hibisca TaxID=68565 RepID=UPI00082D0A8E|nr:HEXXH motif domain-containing protein [Actinomadura hibisca]